MWNTVGGISVVLGVVGIALPLLPTTPFLLLASACFFRGSPAFHQWLQSHPKLGPVITDWEQDRCVTKTVKRRGALLIIASFSLSIFVVEPLWLKLMLLTLFVVTFTFFLRIPVKPPVAE
ncbi:YbaN family protein [Vibrio sp. 10N]|uniref:YbaN family protein n=1 Tax=Vibrio sp. 10N TaxID=3058938 RepID=UPI002812E99C|nr:YbaN family protein [Vibrio sp. 10N]